MDERPTKTRRVLQVAYLQSDGRLNREDITLVLRDPNTGEELRDAHGEPEVFMVLRAIGKAEHEEIVKSCTRHEKGPSGRPTERVDHDEVQNEILRRTIQRWEGLVAADRAPLPCTDQTKVLLPMLVKGQVTRKLFGAEATEVVSESFREPANVPALAR
jgi:hypothetical protein